MTLYAIISDIHANFAALQAVAQNAHNCAVKEDLGSPRFLCLGDVVDYGPQPNECMAWVGKHARDYIVLGNHDGCVLGHYHEHPRLITQEYWPITAWTRLALKAKHKQWMREWSKVHFGRGALKGFGALKDFSWVHASLGEPENDGRVEDRFDAKDQFPIFGDSRYLFFGHTHYQGYHEQAPNRQVTTAYAVHQHNGRRKSNSLDWNPVPINKWLPLPATSKMMLNPGSVGQPRSHSAQERYAGNDNRAAYMLLKMNGRGSGEYQFRRVEYDVEATVRLVKEKITLHHDEKLRDEHDIYWREFPEPEYFDKQAKHFKVMLENLEAELEPVKRLLIKKLRTG